MTKEELTSVHVCLQSSATLSDQDAVEILIKSNRRTLQLMEVPLDRQNLRAPLQVNEFQPILVELASVIETTFFGEQSRSDSSILLFGGSEMAYDLLRPAQNLRINSHSYLTLGIIATNLITSLLGGLEEADYLTLILTVGSCISGIAKADGSLLGIEGKVVDYILPIIECVKGLLSQPNLVVGAATSTALSIGFSQDSAKRAGDYFSTVLNSGRIKGLTKILGRVTFVSSALVNMWDSNVDQIAKSRMTIDLEGDPSLSNSIWNSRIDFGDIEETTGETPLILIADISGSMSDIVGGQTKLGLAKTAMLDFLNTVSPTRQVALRTYPSSGGMECSSGELRFGFSPKTSAMSAIVRNLHADGDTPTAEALRAAVDDIQRAGIVKADIALFSDGLSNCGNPCSVPNEIAATGIDIAVHIGAFVDSQEGRDALKCIADATDGSYVDSSEDTNAFAEKLGEFLERNSIPRLEVALNVPETVFPSTDPTESVQQVEAVIRNDSNVAARDVVASLEVGEDQELVIRPVAVGNIAPGSESRASWLVRPGFNGVGTNLELDLSVTAANTVKSVSSSGSAVIGNPNVPEDAGPIVGAGQIVVMGDQLLSGVGSNTRDPDGRCRRGRDIGLLDVFGQQSERSLACANALITHLTAPDWAKGVDSQVTQLGGLQAEGHPVNGVVLSIGATDFGLAELTQECVLSSVSCDVEISGSPSAVWLQESVAGGGPRQASALSDLVGALGTIDEQLNADRGQSRQAPILLLAQPRAFPFVSGACFQRWQGEDSPLLSQAELNVYHQFVSDVNGTLEAAAVAAQELGLPVLYVDATENAYLPDHTACSAQPYVRSLEPLVEASPGPITALAQDGTPGMVGEELNEEAVAEFSEEFLTPNISGERALANAVLNWSRSDEALQANEAMNDEFVRRSEGVALDLVTTSPDYDSRALDSSESVSLESGHGWGTTVSGFLPGSLVTATMQSTGRVVASSVANAQGTADLYMVLGSEEAALGETTLVVAGRDSSGATVSASQPIEVQPPLRPIYSLVLPLLGLVLLFGSLLLWRASRRETESHPS